MKKSILFSLAALLAALITAGCSTDKTDRHALNAPHGSFDPGANFAGLHTFDFAPPTTAINPDLDASIRGALERSLAEKGFVRAQGTRPDFLVSYTPLVGQQRVEVQYYGNARWSTPMPKYYDEGTLIVDVLNPATQRPMWRNSAWESPRDWHHPDRDQRRIDDAAQKALATFPPRA